MSIETNSGRGGRSAVFLQVRLDSSRLPVKALYELAGKPVVVHCMHNLSNLPADMYCLLTDSASADILAPFARACGWRMFSGPKDDVLARFVLAADHFGIDHVFRGTADNPLVSLELSELIRTAYLQEAADYCVLQNVPHGSCIEAVSAHALRIIRTESTDPFEHEHVCPGVYRRPERFSVLQPQAPKNWARPDIRLTLDTPADYQVLTKLFSQLYAGSPIALGDAINWFDNKGKTI